MIDETERFILNDIRAFDEEKSKVLIDLLHNPHIEFDLFVNNNKVSKKLKKVFNINAFVFNLIVIKYKKIIRSKK